MGDRQLYGVRRSRAALERGARIVCEVRGTAEPGAAYVRVRIVQGARLIFGKDQQARWFEAGRNGRRQG